MRIRNLVLFGGLLAIVSMGTFVWRAETTPGLASEVFDIGTQRPGALIEHRFQPRNNSFHALRIARVKSSCGCTVPDLRDTTVPPFGRMNLPVTINTTGKTGPFQAKITVEFENHPTIELGLTGQVVEEYPAKIDFSSLKRGKTVAKDFVLRSASKDNVRVLSSKYDGAYFKVSSTTLESGTRVEVTVVEEIPYGAFDKVVVLETDDMEVPKKSIRVVGYVLPPVIILPRNPSLGNIESDKLSSIELSLEAPYADELSLIAVDSEHLKYRVVLPNAASSSVTASTPAPKSSVLKVSLSASYEDLPKGLLAEEVKFRVRIGGEEQTISTTVYGMVR